MSEIIIYLLLIVLGLLALYIMVIGFLFIFAMAGEQGFIGLAVFVSCWVFMFPVMLGITALVGLVIGIRQIFK